MPDIYYRYSGSSRVHYQTPEQVRRDVQALWGRVAYYAEISLALRRGRPTPYPISRADARSRLADALKAWATARTLEKAAYGLQ